MTETPWSTIGYLTYQRTYARRIVEDNPNSPLEQWNDTVERVLDSCETQLGVGFNGYENLKFEQYLLDLKCSVAGRFLWQLGTKTVDKLGLFSLQNCAFTIVDNPIRSFTWCMDALMLGSGVGYNIQKKHVYKLPPVLDKKITITRLDTKDADFIVPDTREGWVMLLQKCLEAYFQTGKSFSYSTMLVRSKGAVIRSFGGIASGPEELADGISNIAKILQSRQGKQLDPIHCLDIMNIIGYVVVSGNVRRSAQIAIGDCDDLEFLSAKRWDLGGVPNWRAMSNNSVVCNDFSKLPEQFWEGYKGNGEPYGLINLKLAQTVGRLGDKRYQDKKVMGFNPCAEQGLEPYETCCLAEVFLPRVSTKDEMFDIVKMLYRVCKHSMMLPCHAEETEKVVHKNMRMGIGITGYLQASEEQRSWLPDIYEQLREFDVHYSKKMGFPVSIKLTTCKPSGTLSKLPGVTPGVHPGYARYYIQRIRIPSNSSLVAVCRDHGYHVEPQFNFDGSPDQNTMVVELPFSYPEGTVLAKDVSAIQQLEWVQRMQRDWSDNSVSVTVYYKTEELAGIKEWLAKNYNHGLKTVSFLLHSEHGFKQAPYEEISEEKYNEMVANSRVITSESAAYLGELTLDESADCVGGMCPIR